MDYRSIIQLSYQNNQTAKKEAKRIGDGSNSKSGNKKAPSDEAIKRFLNKKKEEEIERFNKIRVEKPPTVKKKNILDELLSKKKEGVNPSTTKPSDKIDSNVIMSMKDQKTKDVRSHHDMGPKKQKTQKSLSKYPESDQSKKSQTSEKLKSEKKSEQRPSHVTEAKPKSLIPSFTNYQQILQLANRNAEKPPSFVRDPDRGTLENKVPKLKSQNRDKVEKKTNSSFAPEKAASKKRKSDCLDDAQSGDRNRPAPLEKKRREEVPTPSSSKSAEIRNSSKNMTSQKVAPSSSSATTPSSSKDTSQGSVPVRRGIAAQLSILPFPKAAPSLVSSSSAISKKPSVPLHIKGDEVSKTKETSKSSLSGSKTKVQESGNSGQKTSSLSLSQSKVISKSDGRSLGSSGSSGAPMKKGIAAQNSIFKAPSSTPAPKVETPKQSKPSKDPGAAKNNYGGMSITMEDDSNFVHYSRKSEEKAPLKQTVTSQPPVRRGIAAQNGLSATGPPVRRGIAAQSGIGSAFGSAPKSAYRYGMDSDDDYEDEYDEDDDFIDDSEVVTANEFQSVVNEIHRSLRFDPSKYETVRANDDCRSMETSYKEIQKEENRSYRLGLKEDMADIRAEEERLKEKKKKKQEKKAKK